MNLKRPLIGNGVSNILKLNTRRVSYSSDEHAEDGMKVKRDYRLKMKSRARF